MYNWPERPHLIAHLRIVWHRHDFHLYRSVKTPLMWLLCSAFGNAGLHAWVDCGFAVCACCVSPPFIQDEPQEIIKPVPITHPTPSTTYTKPSSQPSPAYNKTARPFGGGSSVVTASSPAAPSIPSQSSAFKPAAPSQPAQPPFLLKSTVPAPDSAPANSLPRPIPGRSTFPSPSASSSSSNSSSPARVTAPSSNPNVPQPSVYNTPINLYSNTNACEVVMGQRRGLLESQGLSEHFNG